MPSEPHALIVRWPGKAWTATDLASRTLPLVLSLTAGSTDIIGFLGLNLFTAHITGNIVVLAAHIVAGDPTIFSYMLSIAVFMLVVFLTRLLAGTLEQAAFRRCRRCCCCSCSFWLLSSAFASWRVHGATPTQYLSALRSGACPVRLLKLGELGGGYPEAGYSFASNTFGILTMSHLLAGAYRPTLAYHPEYPLRSHSSYPPPAAVDLQPAA